MLDSGKLIPGSARDASGKGWRSFEQQIRSVRNNRKLSPKDKSRQVKKFKNLASQAKQLCQSIASVPTASPKPAEKFLGTWSSDYDCSPVYAGEKCQARLLITFNSDGTYQVKINGGAVCIVDSGFGFGYITKPYDFHVVASGTYQVDSAGNISVLQTQAKGDWYWCPIIGSTLSPDSKTSSELINRSSSWNLSADGNSLSLSNPCLLYLNSVYYCDGVDIPAFTRVS